MVFGKCLRRIISVLNVVTLKEEKMLMTFDDDLDFARGAEHMVRDVLKLSGWHDTELNESEDYETRKAYDIHNPSFTCEVKHDRKCESTGNVFIEEACNGVDSGVWGTKADFWVIVTNEGAWMIEVSRLRFLVKNDRDKEGTVREMSGDGGRVSGVTFPKEWMKKHFRKFIREDKSFNKDWVYESFSSQ
jgi:hypothetical protein